MKFLNKLKIVAHYVVTDKFVSFDKSLKKSTKNVIFVFQLLMIVIKMIEHHFKIFLIIKCQF